MTANPAMTAPTGPSHDADIHRHVRGYLIVFATLLLLTLATVAVSYVHLPRHQAIAAAMVFAVIKASLVAAYFMHIGSEGQVVHGVLVFWAIVFVGLGGLTLLGWYDQVRIW
jgi:caa(3)-type oxidase subunit IV